MDFQTMSIFLMALDLSFVVPFAYYFSKDKDLRKLLFISVFLLGFFGQIVFLNQEGIMNQMFPNLDVWIGLSQIFGILIVLVSAVREEIYFKHSFNLFLTTTAISSLIVFIPVEINSVMVPVYATLSFFLMGLSAYHVLQKKNVPNLMFLFTTIFYVIGEFGLYAKILYPETIFISVLNGHIFMALIFLTSKQEKENEGIGSFFAYKAELKETKKELRKSKELLKKSEKMAAVGQVATMVAHDLRNPLQSIQTANCFVEKQLKAIEAENPVFQKSLRMIKISNDSIAYANNIVLDLKDFSSERKPELIMVNVNDVLNDSLARCKVPNNVKIVKEFSQVPMLELDTPMMKRVFVNIISNGIQAMPNGGTFTVSTKKTKDFVEVTLKDQGQGISEENMKKLFSPFFTTKAQGMGMGLAISKKFVELNGGSINVESKESEGTKFTINLPIITERIVINQLQL